MQSSSAFFFNKPGSSTVSIYDYLSFPDAKQEESLTHPSPSLLLFPVSDASLGFMTIRSGIIAYIQDKHASDFFALCRERLVGLNALQYSQLYKKIHHHIGRIAIEVILPNLDNIRITTGPCQGKRVSESLGYLEYLAATFQTATLLTMTEEFPDALVEAARASYEPLQTILPVLYREASKATARFLKKFYDDEQAWMYATLREVTKPVAVAALVLSARPLSPSGR
jgi:hypothetical protein